MTPDKIFGILSGIGIASVLFWWYALVLWHGKRPDYRVTPSYQGPSRDEILSVVLPVTGIVLSATSIAGTVVFSEYPPMTFIGFFLYTTVRFFSESRKHPEAIPPIS